jgi:hypothetical protein
VRPGATWLPTAVERSRIGVAEHLLVLAPGAALASSR